MAASPVFFLTGLLVAAAVLAIGGLITTGSGADVPATATRAGVEAVGLGPVLWGIAAAVAAAILTPLPVPYRGAAALATGAYALTWAMTGSPPLFG